jgi:hypothetical protein
LELFWDSIQRALTNVCQTNQIFPYYRDLDANFTFRLHFLGDSRNPKLSPSNFDQTKRNYRSFGDALRLHLCTTTTIDEQYCPETYLQLLSFYDLHDGFALLRDLIFHRSPQLMGSYHDFKTDIGNLIIIPGEHLSKFYQRTIELYTEISLANIPNGSSTDLCYHFLELLRNTGCSTIQGLTLPYWKLITTHRRNPNHLTTPLPWTFKEVYNTLENSNITFLPTSSTTSSQSSTSVGISPFAAIGSSPSPHFKHYNKTTNNNNTSYQHTNKSISTSNNTFGIHRTRDGRRFITTTNTSRVEPSRPACVICYNRPVNPWHSTNNCPYKHPTHIIDKDIRERVLQHNAIHGTEKRNFNKTTDIHRSGPPPPQTAATGSIIIPDTAPGTPSNSSTSPSSSPDIETDLSRLKEDNILLPNDEVIESEYFSYPAEANLGHSTSPDFTADEIISDHLQYLSYHS